MLYKELQERGLVFQETSENLKKALETPMHFYCGADPTSDSLHVGSLLPLITMRRLQKWGHTPILLLGGATGMIGDPSGKSKERVLMDHAIIEKNRAGIYENAKCVLDFEGANGAVLVNNLDWIGSFSYIDFLRDVGKHFPVNVMIAKDSVKSRLTDRDQGISYTEFSYMLLQAYDFYYLNEKHDCKLQIGGSDQWGNITAGVDLIRRMQGDVQNKKEVYGMTFPLVTKSDGSKFGKSEQGNVWLSAEKTSPYQFYQFFVRLNDTDIKKLIYYFSLKPIEEIRDILTAFEQEPHKRGAQIALAEEMTLMIHGEAELQNAKKATQALFSGDFASLDEKTLLDVFSDVPSLAMAKSQLEGMDLVSLLAESKLCQSKGAARKDIKAGAIYLNNEKFTAENLQGSELPLLHESILILRKGKKNYCLVKIFQG